VILSNDGVFEPAELETFEPSPAEISSPTLEDKVRQEILTACQRANWKLGGPRGAAARLGLKRTTLFYKMKRLGMHASSGPIGRIDSRSLWDPAGACSTSFRQPFRTEFTRFRNTRHSQLSILS